MPGHRLVWFRSGLALAGLLVLAACAEPLPPDYRETYALQVQPETVIFPARFVGTQDPFTGEAAERFDTLVSGYLDGGHGPMTATTVLGAPNEARARLRLASTRAHLIAAGIPESAIRVVFATAGAPDTVTLSYERYNTIPPGCGDWSSELSIHFFNHPWANFGCASQRNIGLMVADPADLVGARAPAPAIDAASSDRVTDAYRLGKSTSATPAQEPALLPIPSASFSGLGTGGAGGAPH